MTKSQKKRTGSGKRRPTSKVRSHSSSRSRSSRSRTAAQERSRKRKLRIAVIAILTVALAVVSAIYLVHRVTIQQLEEQQSQLASEFDYNPGNLISDTDFFDASAMSTRQIQEFLVKHGANCSGKQCLKNARFTVAREKGDNLCEAYKGSGKKSGAEVIAAAAKSCGINPEVILVMLEKEQGLVSTSEPTKQKFASALGLSCPDNASCDKKYDGFFKQVYGAARRFKYYQANPDQYSYQAQSINYVQYSPNAACGGSKVYIENEATALLYIYTPYQPNSAALRADWGTGDSCSSYGNRNFVKLYEAWFK
ncbi:MAG: hemagglutinin [Bifidobacteriaceae bacterium]|jgi:hypothetical protein|nr:hemagglutinin [Bifidobacteriaceae bacterium]